MHRSYARSWDTIQLKRKFFQVERLHLPFLRYEERVTRSSRPDYAHLGTTAATYADPRRPLPYRRAYMAHISRAKRRNETRSE